MIRKKIAGGIAAAILLALIIWAAATVPEPPASDDAQSGARVMSYEDNTLREERDGRLVWTLTAQKMSVDIDTQNTTMQGIEGIFYDEDGRTLSLKADEGHMDSSTHDVILTGGISAETSDGITLRSNAIQWTAADRVLSADGDAVLTRDNLYARGDRIASTDEFRQFTIEGNAHIEKGGESK